MLENIKVTKLSFETKFYLKVHFFQFDNIKIEIMRYIEVMCE